MSTAIQVEANPAAPFGTVCLRLVLVSVGVACLTGFWYANSHTDDYRLHYPLFTPWLWNLYLTFELASVVALIAMWNWRKWGLWLLASMAIAMLFTEFYTMGFSLTSLRIPLVLAIVWFAAHRVWNRFQ